jgi:hypothetical protein
VSEVRHDTSLALARRRLKLGATEHLGRNYWYFAPGRAANILLKVRHGVVLEAESSPAGYRNLRSERVRGTAALLPRRCVIRRATRRGSRGFSDAGVRSTVGLFVGVRD